MSPQTENKHTPESDYPEISLPIGGFKSNIPEYLLHESDPQMKWLMEEMSKNTQATNFGVTAAIDTNTQVRKTNGRLKMAEKNITDLKQDVIILKGQMDNINPLAASISTIRVILSNRLFILIAAMGILFLLGFNRSVIADLIKILF